MSDVERYDLQREGWIDMMRTHPEGDWVRYDDYKALALRLNAALGQLAATRHEASLETRRDAICIDTLRRDLKEQGYRLQDGSKRLDRIFGIVSRYESDHYDAETALQRLVDEFPDGFSFGYDYDNSGLELPRDRVVERHELEK